MVRVHTQMILACWLVLVTGIMLMMGLGATRQGAIVTFIGTVDQQTDIYQVDAARGEIINLTQTRAPEWSFGWSIYDALYYTASVNVGQAADELFVMHRLGAAQLIETPQTLYSFGGVWSPDGNTFAYFSSHPRNVSDIYTITFPDETIRNLTQTDDISESNPLWSPDGMLLSYRQDGDVYLIDTRDGARRLLVDMTTATIEDPVWSPDATQMIFYTREWRNGRQQLDAYRVRIADGDVMPLDLPRTVNSPVTWSPDSQQIALIADEQTLLLVDLTSGEQTRIAGDNRRFAPAWSLDGAWIAFIENRDLHLYHVETGNLQGIETGVHVKPPLRWRP